MEKPVTHLGFQCVLNPDKRLVFEQLANSAKWEFTNQLAKLYGAKTAKFS